MSAASPCSFAYSPVHKKLATVSSKSLLSSSVSSSQHSAIRPKSLSVNGVADLKYCSIGVALAYPLPNSQRRWGRCPHQHCVEDSCQQAYQHCFHWQPCLAAYQHGCPLQHRLAPSSVDPRPLTSSCTSRYQQAYQHWLEERLLFFQPAPKQQPISTGFGNDAW